VREARGRPWGDSLEPGDRGEATHSRPRGRASGGCGGDGGESNSPSRTRRQGPLRACPMVCRRPPERPSAGYRAVQSRAPRSGLVRPYATLAPAASSLDDASTAREEEAASTLTLPPKRRRRESTGGCQVLRFAACLTRPDGTSARTPGQLDPVESTHPRAPSLARRPGSAKGAAPFGHPPPTAWEPRVNGVGARYDVPRCA
jgi:hypothetical protein